MIHPGLAAQLQIILHLGDEQPGNAAHTAANHAPDIALLPVEAQICLGVGPILPAGLVKPLLQGHVVVGAGVAHGIHGIQMGQVIAFLPGVEGEFQHLHAGIAGVQLKLANLRGDEAQILGDEVQLRQGLPHRADKWQAGAFHPFSVPGGLVPGGHSPVAFEAPEVVKPHHIVHARGGRQPLNPPAEAVIRHGLPVVDGISPELPVGGEAIRGAARYDCGMPALVQLEQFIVYPHVGAVQRNIDGYVADDADALPVGVSAQGLPLAEKQILYKVVISNLLFMGLPGSFQSGFLPQAQTILPVQPGRASVAFLQRHEQGVIRQPGTIFLQESGVALIGRKTAVGKAQKLSPLLVEPAETHTGGHICPADHPRLFRLQQPLLHQCVQINEIGIAGKGREGLVGGIPVARWIQRQNLPAGLAGLGKEIHEMISLLSHGAHAVRSGQGSDVH